MNGVPAAGWLLFMLVLGLGLEWADSKSVVFLSSVGEVHAQVLPLRVVMEGSVSSIRESRSSVAFDLVNGGRVTCYYRHPPHVLSLFPDDWVQVRARIEQTPQGRLCVVEELSFRGVA